MKKIEKFAIKLIPGIAKIEKNYKYIYEDMAKPLLIKYHFVPSQISLKDILLKEISNTRIVYHYFHYIKRDLDSPSKNGLELVILRESLKSLAHEISHIAQKITAAYYPSFDIETTKDEARAEIFEMVSTVSLATLEFEENKKHLKIEFDSNSYRGANINEDQKWEAKELSGGSSNFVNIKRIPAIKNYVGYEKGQKEFFELIGGRSISTWGKNW
ncbi:MAG: hypothetical protein COB38_08345 [Gammaproteobacteria bacterium]|nr:MAG: hypothetical protein COB38_08345 [Gammaproteobacteria bacterium]